MQNRPSKVHLKATQQKESLHSRNRHRGRYDFNSLIHAHGELASYLSITPYGDQSIDFTNPEAVKALNCALLIHFYKIHQWDLPTGYLCPPIPGRADYLHYLADLLASCNGGVIPRGASIRGLDIGVGANCIYPIIGQYEYGWHFVGSDIDPIALASAARIIQANEGLQAAIELRMQPSPSQIFKGILSNENRPSESRPSENSSSEQAFDFSLCNPPFHESIDKAHEGTRQKWKNLGRDSCNCEQTTPLLNFGGQGRELWCPGGEKAFICQMVRESAQYPTRVFWYTSLVSKESSLEAIYREIKRAKALDMRTLEMAQGNKRSRIVAWTFWSEQRQKQWCNHYRR